MKLKLIIITVLIALLLSIFYIKRWIEIDRCLDSGGHWNYEINKCEYAGGDKK